MSVIDSATVRAFLKQAWEDSNPGTDTAHEEGGFILLQPDGSFCVERWPRGDQNEIDVPPHPGCRRNNLPIVATFHTHPNVGPEFQQEPAFTDILAVKGDRNLKSPEYEGEFVIATELTYRIRPSGKVEIVERTKQLFKGV
jgi:hypothetical protein